MPMDTAVPPPVTSLSTTVLLPSGRYWMGDPGALAVTLCDDDAADPDMRPRRIDASGLTGPGAFCRSVRRDTRYLMGLGRPGVDRNPLPIQSHGDHVAILPVVENETRWLSRRCGMGLCIWLPMEFIVSRSGPDDADVVITGASDDHVVCGLRLAG